MIRTIRDPEGVVHWWYEGTDVLNAETLCEYYDNRAYWPEELMQETDDVPTCLRCVVHK